MKQFSCRKLYFCILLFCFFYSATYSISFNKDSLRSVISSATDIKIKTDALNTLAYEYRRGDVDSGMYYAEQALKLSKKINYRSGFGDYYRCMGTFLFYNDPDTGIFLLNKALKEFEADNNEVKVSIVYSNLGNIYIMQNQYDSALHYCFTALERINKSKQMKPEEKENRIMWIYQSFGNIYFYKSFYDSSMYYSVKGLAIAEKQGDINAQSTFYEEMGLVSMQMEEYSKAIEFYTKAATIELSLKNYAGLILSLSNLGDAYVYLDNFNKAVALADSALAMGLSHEIFRHIPHNYNTLGLATFKRGDCQGAIKLYQLGLEACKQYGNDFIKGNLLLDLGNAQVCISEYHKAIENYKEACTYFDEALENLYFCYEGMYKAYAAINDYKNSVHYLELAVQLNDSIFNTDKIKIVNDLKLKYESEKKEQQILFLKNESKLNEQLADKENQGKNYAFAGIGLLLVSGAYIFYLFSKKRRLSNKLSTSLVELKQAQSQLIALEKEKEAEAIRLRISRDIHDDIGSNLTKISMLGNLAVAKGVNNTPELTAHLYKISDYARNVNRSMSEIIWAVNPGQDTLENLFTYMKVHALDFLNNSGTELQINFPHENIDYQLNPDLKRSLFLTLKECLNNAIKYSGATLITINFQVYNAHFEFKISDNGKGFDPNNIAAGKGGNGLINLETRLKSVGCTFSVVSKPQQGCTIIVKGAL